MAKVYSGYLINGDSENHWISQFKRWSNLIDTKVTASGVQGIGIMEIYDKKVAKLYIPYSLSDGLIMSMYLWQKDLHTGLHSNGDSKLSIPVPKT